MDPQRFAPSRPLVKPNQEAAVEKRHDGIRAQYFPGRAAVEQDRTGPSITAIHFPQFFNVEYGIVLAYSVHGAFRFWIAGFHGWADPRLRQASKE